MNILLAAVIALFSAGSAAAGEKLIGAVESIARNVVASGGGISSGGGFTLQSVIAETGASSFTGTGHRFHAGLGNIFAQPGSITSLVSATKSTGTLELTWNAPGIDGFIGDVASGFYRIDSSSDPLHAFAPTTYQTEFATAVSPGDPQSYILTGLEPNTTYFTRIYLSDARKMAAETSAPSEESTLANLPASPLLTGVFQTSVTLSWTLPVGGAEGFHTDASTTNFLGGTTLSSTTRDDLAVSMIIDGLACDTTFFFNLGSLNWQDDFNFNTVISTRTALCGPLPIENLVLTADALNRNVTLTWTNPAYFQPAGVTVLVSTNPITGSPSQGVGYAEGAAFSDGSVVKASAAAASHIETGLVLNTTSYFSLYSKDVWNSYSVAVSTTMALDLPPLAPAGLAMDVTPDGSSVTISWSNVVSNSDGSGFRNSVSPLAEELTHYDMYRSTGITFANWVLVASTPIFAGSMTAAVPDPSRTYFYKVVSADVYSEKWADISMVMDSDKNLYAIGPDKVSRIMVPTEHTGILRPAGNDYSDPILVRATERPQDLKDRVVRSVMFSAYRAPSLEPAALTFPNGSLDVNLRYEVAGGQVVPSAAGPAGARLASALELGLGPKPTGVSVMSAPENLSAYWSNTLKQYIKVFGSVDTAGQTVRLASSMLGNYQIRAVLRDLGFNFDASGLSNKALTPNGDGLNDTVVVVFDNPKDSEVTGKIYDTRGSLVADMTAGPLARISLLWDGKSNGVAVPRGIYIYQIQAEEKTFSGTVVVIR